MAATKTDFSTPDIPMSEATWYVSACTRINAPASLVFRTLRNTETWKDWNRWIPTVTITDQPDDEDDATIAEIEELVRNTSIAVNHDSEITDGGIMPDVQKQEPRRGSITWAAVGAHSGGASLAPGESSPRPSRDRPQSPVAEFIAPPVTRQRLASNASRISAMSNTSDTPRHSSHNSNGGMSGAQKFQAAQEARKASVSSGQSNGVETGSNSVMLEVPGSNSVLMPAPKNTGATALAVAQKNSDRRKSSASARAERKRLHLNALYGEPSVRIQEGTRMTLHIKTKLPSSPHETRDLNVATTEVSRPDDPLDEPGPISSLQRTQTHTVSKSGVYRLVWTVEGKYNPPKSYPKFLLQLQRVHEIRPIVQGDGKEMCEYWQWEAQRGMLAKKAKKDAPYYQQRMDEWGLRLGEFCESMGGAVERRDFMV